MNILKFILPPVLSTIYVLLREGAFFLILIIGFASSDLLRGKIRKYEVILAALLVVCSYFLFIAPRMTDAFTNLLLYISGPALFFSIVNDKSGVSASRIMTILTIMIGAIIIIGLILYPFQEQYFSAIDIKEKTKNFTQLYRWSNDNTASLRLSGIDVHPTELAGFCIIMLIQRWYKCITLNKTMIIIIIAAMILTSTRIFYIGAAIWILWAFPKAYRLWIGSLVVTGIVVFIYMVIKKLIPITLIDPSTIIHLTDFFIRGPSDVILYWKGLGLGTAGAYSSVPGVHYESDLFLGIVQIGFIGIVVYLYFLNLVNQQISIYRTKEIRASKMILFVFSFASLFFGIYLIRSITNIFWMFVALNYRMAEECEGKRRTCYE
jgi:hypothetical protein